MNVLIIGPIKDSCRLNDIKYDVVVAVDGGIVRAKERNIFVDVAIGDFDSLDEKEKDLLFDIPKVVKMNKNKDLSDFECALDYLSVKNDIFNIYAVGFLYGNRLDHLILNFLLLYKYKELNIYLIANKSLVFLLKKGNYYLKNYGYKYISFFSLKTTTISLRKGFKFKVENELISPTHVKFLSNEFVNDVAYIENMDDIIVCYSSD